jgi:hypothetical protein
MVLSGECYGGIFPEAFILSSHGPQKHSWIGFTGRTWIRFCDQNPIAIDPDLFLIAIMIAITVSKPGSNWEMKIVDRFSHENRDPIAQ